MWVSSHSDCEECTVAQEKCLWVCTCTISFCAVTGLFAIFIMLATLFLSSTGIMHCFSIILFNRKILHVHHLCICVSNLQCGSVAEWLGCWTCDQQVTGSNPSLSAVECNPGQVVNTHVPLSPSSIIWYQPMGGDALRLGR